jgi:hypothetical protein
VLFAFCWHWKLGRLLGKSVDTHGSSKHPEMWCCNHTKLCFRYHSLASQPSTSPHSIPPLSFSSAVNPRTPWLPPIPSRARRQPLPTSAPRIPRRHAPPPPNQYPLASPPIALPLPTRPPPPRHHKTTPSCLHFPADCTPPQPPLDLWCPRSESRPPARPKVIPGHRRDRRRPSVRSLHPLPPGGNHRLSEPLHNGDGSCRGTPARQIRATSTTTDPTRSKSVAALGSIRSPPSSMTDQGEEHDGGSGTASRATG